LRSYIKKRLRGPENFGVHAINVSEPKVANNHFVINFWMDTTHKLSGYGF
jgi:hypothetical protein